MFSSFLELKVTAIDEITLGKFKGLVESRIRSLIRSLEQSAKRPHPDFFRLIPTTDVIGGSFFIGLAGSLLDLRPAISQFITETMEKSLQAPEWADISPESIKLEISVTTNPFPSVSKNDAKRQRIDNAT